MDHTEELSTTTDRLAAAATALEQLAQRLTENDEATIGRIVAQIDERRESDLEQKLAAAEQRIAELEAEIATLQRTIRRLKRGGDGGSEAA